MLENLRGSLKAGNLWFINLQYLVRVDGFSGYFQSNKVLCVLTGKDCDQIRGDLVELNGILEIFLMFMKGLLI